MTLKTWLVGWALPTEMLKKIYRSRDLCKWWAVPTLHIQKALCALCASVANINFNLIKKLGIVLNIMRHLGQL